MNYDATVQTISWLCDRYREGTLKLKPPYQRKPVWAMRQKCYLVESILLELPVPEVYIQQTTSAEGTTKYAVVDGQQRIRAILQFIGSEDDPDEAEYSKFALDKLNDTSKWKDAAFSDLSDAAKRQFFGYKLAVRFLNTDSDPDVRDMFIRLNKFLAPLRAQELRNSIFVGPFVQLAEKLADDEYWAENRIVRASSIRRMGDVEFISELLIGVMHGPQGGSSSIIDEYYRQYEDYEDNFPGQQKAERLFSRTHSLVKEMFPDIKERRWSNKTDFYSLFVALALTLKKLKLPGSYVTRLRKGLVGFEEEVEKVFEEEGARVSREAGLYAKAVQRGVTHKARRAERQEALGNVIDRSLAQHKGRAK